jgi:hypothetical protein
MEVNGQKYGPRSMQKSKMMLGARNKAAVVPERQGGGNNRRLFSIGQFVNNE